MNVAALNSARRRIRRYADWARVGWSKLGAASHCEAFDGRLRVALLSVSFNTRELTKLMLLSLADQPWAQQLGRVVIVDNGSQDGSPDLLDQLARSTRIECVHNTGPSSHGFGLRRAVSWIEQTEAGWPSERRSNVYLVADTDIIFLRADTLSACSQALSASDVGALGELQFDLGEPYAHPCCLFVRRDALADPRVWPFVDHGAPALWLERSLRCAGRIVLDFPLRSQDHIVHRGRASIAAVNALGLSSPYANVRHDAHFHGNPRGAELWAALEERHRDHVGQSNDVAAAQHIAAGLGPRPY